MSAIFPGSGGGGGDGLWVGGIFMPKAGLKILTASVAVNGANSSFGNASIGDITRGSYQVPVGKVFTLWAAKFYQISAAATTIVMVLRYSDNDVGDNSAAALVNPVGLITGVAGGDTYDAPFPMSFTVNQEPKEVALGGQAPAGKYINILSNGSTYAQMYLYGYEVDA